MPRDRRPGAGTPAASLHAAALRLLGRRDLTRAELTSRLIARGYQASAVDALLERLVADHWVDDRRTAFAHARTSSRVKGRGRLRILRELQARGVSADVASSAVGEISTDDEVLEIVRLVRRKRVVVPLTPADRQRLRQQLIRRGFPSDLITRALRMAAATDD